VVSASHSAAIIGNALRAVVARVLSAGGEGAFSPIISCIKTSSPHSYRVWMREPDANVHTIPRVLERWQPILKIIYFI
jgi:hypothetical protein